MWKFKKEKKREPSEKEHLGLEIPVSSPKPFTYIFLGIGNFLDSQYFNLS